MGGGDKPLRMVGDRTLLDRVLACATPQCAELVLNANGDPARFAALRRPVVPDTLPDHPGPLAGVLAALEWAEAHRPDVAWVASFPGDAPFLPRDLVPRLHAAREGRAGTRIALAASGGRRHPVAALWHVGLREELRRALTAEGLRRVGAFVERHSHAVAEWPIRPVDPFFNANTGEDLLKAERLLSDAAAL